jgi:hypothetical protein
MTTIEMAIAALDRLTPDDISNCADAPTLLRLREVVLRWAESAGAQLD